MARSMVSSCSRVGLRVAAVSFIAVFAAGCSNSGRSFDFSSFSSKRSETSAETTGSIAARPAPSTKVEAQALPAPTRPATVPAQTAGMTQGGQGLGAYRPTGDITGSVAAPARPAPAGQWTWEGGTPVTVGQNESVETIARKYGVPISALMQTNNVANAADVRPGQRLVIPRYTVAAVAPQSAPPPVAAPAVTSAHVAAKSAESVHLVQPGEGLIGIARSYNIPINTLAKHNNMLPYAKVNAGDRIKIPAGYASATPPQQHASVAPVAPVAPRAAPPAPVPPPQVASAPATQSARMISPEPPKDEAAAVKSADATGALPSFRWPVKGRVITAFGSKTNGAQNDGINIAVPEGTPIKAAEDGVVAYAGSELKGYGNLVLVRHSNGYVSAYAHASELSVKRGDTIKRGQLIGKAGQTGNVTSPQLHFEIRKGATPVDPSQFLGSQG